MDTPTAPVAREVAAEENIQGRVKKILAVEGHEVMKAWMKVAEVVVVIAVVRPPVSMGAQISGKCRDAVGAVFVCWA
jgi:hypothetical protein